MVKVSYSLPLHVGKLKKLVLHASHFSLIILTLQLHTPFTSHVSPFDPSALQLQAEKRNNKHKPKLFKNLNYENL